MSNFDRMLGRNAGKEKEQETKEPQMIRVYDQYGREGFMPRDEWRKSVLPGSIRRAWDNADELYGIVVNALQDGFRADVLEAAERLCKIDGNAARGACIWGIVLMEEGRLDQAERVFNSHTSEHGETGVILTNLAKVYSRRGDGKKAEAALWHALEVDPNQDNAVGWYEAIHRERKDGAAGLEALRRVAKLPGSWRAQMWLARAELRARNLAGAMEFYRESLSRMPSPVPADALMQISGDLGQMGHLVELLELAAPRFVPEVHGMPVGNNLIKASVDLGQLGPAKDIVNRLHALRRPDWREALNFWEAAIAKASVGADPYPGDKDLEVAMARIDGPVWLRRKSPAAELFPANTPPAVRIAFLSGTVGGGDGSLRLERQLADARGRLSRAIPFFFAEQVELCSDGSARTLVPWMSKDGGFVLSGSPWDDKHAANIVRNDDIEYVVTLHLVTDGMPWGAIARLIRVDDGQCVGELGVEMTPEDPAPGVTRLAAKLLELLGGQAGLKPKPAAYSVPEAKAFGNYLLRLEQLLAVRCAAFSGGRHGDFLSGEREILEGSLEQSLAFPENTALRVLFAETLLSMKAVRPDVVREFRERARLLQNEHPLDGAAQGVLQRMLDAAWS